MRRHAKRRLLGEINVVPYIDVMLVLLIIFMVTAPLLTQGIEVELPKAAAEPIDAGQDDPPLVLSIDAQGRYYLSVGEATDAPIEADEVVRLASIVLRRKPETPVLVKADRKVAYGSVVEGMLLLQQSGAAKLGFLTDPAEPPPRRSRRS